jgi:hypothetical protein
MPSGNGPLTAWSAAFGPHDLALASPAGFAAASADGTQVAFFGNLDVNEVKGDLTLANADASSPKVLATAVDVASIDCAPQIGFVGAKLVAAHCATPALQPAAITVYDAMAAPIDLQQNAQPLWWADAQATSVLVAALGAATGDGGMAPNVGRVFPLGGGAPTIDNLTDFSDGRLTPDGSAAIYTTSAGALLRGGAGAGALVASGVDALQAVSPNGAWVVYSTQQNGQLTDLKLVSSTVGGQPSPLSASPDATIGGIFGQSFSSDSTWALFYGAVDTTNLIGTLSVQPVAGGNRTALAGSSTVALAAGGTRVVFDQNFTADPNGAGNADVLAQNLGASTPPTLLATQAKITFFVTSDEKSLVYSFHLDPNRAGIYAVNLP